MLPPRLSCSAQPGSARGSSAGSVSLLSLSSRPVPQKVRSVILWTGACLARLLLRLSCLGSESRAGGCARSEARRGGIWHLLGRRGQASSGCKLPSHRLCLCWLGRTGLLPLRSGSSGRGEEASPRCCAQAREWRCCLSYSVAHVVLPDWGWSPRALLGRVPYPLHHQEARKETFVLCSWYLWRYFKTELPHGGQKAAFKMPLFSCSGGFHPADCLLSSATRL